METCRRHNFLMGLIIPIMRKEFMKKFDKEYFTQYTPEKKYLESKGIYPSFIKKVSGVTTYKYTKTSNLFKELQAFYD